MTRKSLWLFSSVGTTELCYGKDEAQRKVNLLMPQERWLEGLRFRANVLLADLGLLLKDLIKKKLLRNTN